MPKTRRALPVLAAVLLAVVVPAAPASAHSKLKSTSPAANATVTTALTEISLTFNEPVKQQNTTIAVNGPDGVSYSDGAARRVDNTVTQAVKPLPTGAISVVWKTVSTDGDPISGQFAFTNTAAPPASAAPAPSPTAAAVSSATPNAQPAADERSGGGLWWVLGAAAAVLLVAAGGFVWVRKRST
jgi:copper resistance protein C